MNGGIGGGNGELKTIKSRGSSKIIRSSVASYI